MGKHIIEIMFQFQNLAESGAISDLEDAGNKSGTAFAKEFYNAQEAVAGGMTDIPVVSALKQALSSIDWGHPIKSAMRVASSAMSELQAKLGPVGKVVLGIGAGLLLLFKSLVGPQQQMVQLFSQLPVRLRFANEAGEELATTMGDKVHKSLMSVMDIAQTMGTSLEDTAATYATLGQMRVPVADLQALTQTSLMASKALGANVDQTTELVGNLRVMGRLNDEQITGLLTNFSQIQDAVGLTQNEMSQLITTTSELTRYMGSFGAAPADINNMAEATAKLTGVFGELGLGAERAGQIMSRIFDPSRLSENVMLVTQMGISMQEYMDMLQGGEVNQVKLTEGLVEAAGQIEQMRAAGVNAFALQQRAQMMGFSNVQEALRLAQEGGETLATMNKEIAQFGRTLETAAAEGMSDLAGATNRLKNRFLATFAQAAVPLVSKLTVVVEALEKRFLENEAAIMNFFDTVITGFANWIANVDMEQIIQWFGNLWSGVINLIEGVKAIIPFLGVLAGAFVGLKVAGAIIPIFGGLSGILGKLVPQLGGLSSAAGGATQTVGGFGSAMAGSLSVFIKMGGVALVIMAIAGAIWILAQALVKFNEVEWSSLAKAGVALLALTGIMFGLGALFMSPAGAVLLAGMAALAAMSVAVALLGVALMSLASGLNAIDPQALLDLAAIAGPDLVESLRTTGKAIGAFTKGVGLFAILNAGAILAVGEGIKRLALGLWVLSETPDFVGIAKDLADLAESLKTLMKSRFRGNIDEVGEAFAGLTEGIKTLVNMDTGKLGDIGTDMLDMTDGLTSWLSAMKEGSTANLWGLGKDLSDLGSGFKDLALGIWVMGEASAGTKAFLANADQIADGVGLIVGALKDAPLIGAGGRADALSTLMGALGEATELPAIAGSLGEAANGVAALGLALQNWIGMGGATRIFKNFLEGLNEAGPIQVDMETPEGEEVNVRGRMTSLEGAGGTEISLQAAYEAQTNRLIEAIGSLEESLVGEDGASGVLGMIMGTMSQWNRSGLKTRTT